MDMSTLIVDDHAGFRRSARVLLEMDGFRVVGEAADGAAAIKAFEALAPELVVLDVQLPDTDGFDVARTILRRNPRTRIAMVSSRDESDYGDSVVLSGAVGFVAKAELSGAALRAVLAREAAST
jgi:DNA-binding NarL/FixJ family response regulator